MCIECIRCEQCKLISDKLYFLTVLISITFLGIPNHSIDCPNNCNAETGLGTCMPRTTATGEEQKYECRCIDGYIGRDCGGKPTNKYFS